MVRKFPLEHWSLICESISEPQPSPFKMSSEQKFGRAEWKEQIKDTFKFLAIMPCWKSGGDLKWMMCIESKAKSAKPYMAKKLWLGGISPLFQTEHLRAHHKNIIYVLLGEETLSHEPWLVEEGESLSAQRKEETSERLSLQPAWKWRVAWCFPRDHTEK